MGSEILASLHSNLTKSLFYSFFFLDHGNGESIKKIQVLKFKKYGNRFRPDVLTNSLDNIKTKCLFTMFGSRKIIKQL